MAALATKGAQAGTYYGSVRWGWRTDSAGNLTKIDLQKVSDGVPSSTFIKAAGIWDKGVSSTGAANVKLGAPGIMVTKGSVTLTPKAVVMLPIVLPVGTRLQIVSGFYPPFLPGSGTVKVVDGPHTGVVGDINVGLAPGHSCRRRGPMAPPAIVQNDRDAMEPGVRKDSSGPQPRGLSRSVPCRRSQPGEIDLGRWPEPRRH